MVPANIKIISWGTFGDHLVLGTSKTICRADVSVTLVTLQTNFICWFKPLCALCVPVICTKTIHLEINAAKGSFSGVIFLHRLGQKHGRFHKMTLSCSFSSLTSCVVS